ncbi:MAG TPA: hypothetical protein VI451_10390 [Anaerolineales bacterium]|nr:hypothetical protein [Anaerolineales bacterium]
MKFDPSTDTLPLRLDMVTMLEYLRDHKITGTQSTGNFPLKAIREITAHFVKPPVIDTVIGERTYKLRREEEVWAIHFLHTLADAGELLSGGQARQIRLTSNGEKFLRTAPINQIMYMFSSWWFNVNWIIAYPFEGMGESLPPKFTRKTLAQLCALPVDTWQDFDAFADELIQVTGLKWPSQDTSFHRMILHGAVEQMIIRILADFGGTERKYRDKFIGNSKFQELDQFKITPSGQFLLNFLKNP